MDQVGELIFNTIGQLRIDIVRIIFGYGKNCSGIPFSDLYSQYRENYGFRKRIR